MKQKIRCFSCCSRGSEVEEEEAPSLLRSSSMWMILSSIRSSGTMARMKKSVRGGYGDFSYDPLSYALNFDGGGEIDDGAASNEKEVFYRSFSSRLPPATSMHTAAVRVAFG